jgi:hypothetical protein
MNLLEKVIEVAIARSPIILKMCELLEQIVKEKNDLKVIIDDLDQQIKVQNTAIVELFTRQHLILKSLKTSSTDIKMPNIGDDKDGTSGPN